jgi:hypothetical protein
MDFCEPLLLPLSNCDILALNPAPVMKVGSFFLLYCIGGGDTGDASYISYALSFKDCIALSGDTL